MKLFIHNIDQTENSVENINFNTKKHYFLYVFVNHNSLDLIGTYLYYIIYSQPIFVFRDYFRF